MTPEQLKDVFTKPFGRLLILGVIGVVIAAGVLVGHRLQEDHHVASQVINWKAKYNYLIINITNDFKKAQTDSQANNTDALAVDCSQIVKDIKAAQAKPAIPDSSIQHNWSVALKDDSVGGTDCTEGIKASDTSKMSQASTNFTNGATALSAASKGMQALKK